MATSTELLPTPYILVLTGTGLLIAFVAWMPLVLRRLPLSLPIICLAIGAALWGLAPMPFRPMPVDFPLLTERITELIVIVSLMGAGLKIDRIVGWRRWAATWRLLAITMPLSIALIAVLGTWAGLAWPAAILLGACLAPTDPVLASDVQVGPPQMGEEDEARFALTSEAGLNDALAFPFVHLAIALSLSAITGEAWLGEWLAVAVLWKLAFGLIGGWLVGRVFGWLVFNAPADSSLAKTGDGIVAIAATLVSYGVTEMIGGYGFLAVFVTALGIRHAHRLHSFQREMHDMIDQMERLLLMAFMLAVGGAVMTGLLADLDWLDVAVALAVLIVVRPVTGLLALAGHPASTREKGVVAFFGIRGVGSFYYLAYGLNHGHFADPSRLWTIVGGVVVLSVFLHGLTVTPLMRQLDRAHGRDPDAEPPKV